MNRWNSDAFASKKIAKIIQQNVKTDLKISPHPHFGWRSLPNQNLKTISTNEQGLRGPRISIDESELWFLIGGSFAWGFGASSNEFIPSALIEKYYKNHHPNSSISLLNLAEQMYTSIEEIKSFLFSVDELMPSTVIIMTGFNDIAVKNAKNLDLYIKQLNFFYWGNTTGLLHSNSWLKSVAKILLSVKNKTKLNFFKPDYFRFNNKECTPMDMFQHKEEIIRSYSKNKDIRIIFCLQPLIFYKKNKSKFEEDYIKFIANDPKYGKNYINDILRNYAKIREYFQAQEKCKNIFFEDTTSYFDEINDAIFFDECHISDEGYKIYINKLAQIVSKLN
jgi:hypothetical protein